MYYSDAYIQNKRKKIVNNCSKSHRMILFVFPRILDFIGIHQNKLLNAIFMNFGLQAPNKYKQSRTILMYDKEFKITEK